MTTDQRIPIWLVTCIGCGNPIPHEFFNGTWRCSCGEAAIMVSELARRVACRSVALAYAPGVTPTRAAFDTTFDMVAEDPDWWRDQIQSEFSR